MAQKIIKNPLDDSSLNNTNHNFTELYKGLNEVNKNVNGIVDRISEEALNKVIDKSKLKWIDRVDDLAELPEDPDVGTTVGVMQDDTLYRYDGEKWVPIYEMNLSPIAELDRKLTTQLENDLSVNPSNTSVWTPPTMPDTLRGNGTIPNGYDPDEHLDALIEPLVDGEYVTRKDLGLTQDGEYTMRRYDFTPSKYEKTIIITSCLHGNEYTGFFALYQFLDLLVNRWQEFPQLAYLRKNVRIITIPIINMWGFANQKRQNSREVDLNRNFPLYWEGFSSTTPGNRYYKGEAPLSEAESKILDQLLKDFPDAVAHMDFHTTNVVDGEYVFYHARLLENQTRPFEKLAQTLRKPSERIIWSASKLPEFTTHSIAHFNINAGNPEFVNGIYGETRSSIEMTRAVQWFGNVILEAAKLQKPSYEVLDDPYFKVVKYDRTNVDDEISFTNQIYSNIDLSYLSFDVKVPGIILFDGHITFHANSFAEGKEVSFFPHIYQPGATDLDYNSTKDNPVSDTKIRVDNQGYYTAPLHGQFFAQVTSDQEQRVGNAVVRLRGKTSGGRIRIYNFVGRISFIPSTTGKRLEVYNATGRESNGIDAMKKVFPDDATDLNGFD